MIRIAVCDDTAMETELIREMFEEYRSPQPHIPIHIEYFGSAETLLWKEKTDKPFDIYLLDIILPGIDGVSLARQLASGGGKKNIIFLTNSTDHAVEAFSVRAVDYLVKPVQKARLFSVMDSVITELAKSFEVSTMLHTPRINTPVKLADIVAVEVTGHTLRYLLTGGREYHSKALRISFEQAAQDIINDSRFLRPHRSYLINMAHVEKLDKYQFVMQGGVQIPISRLRYAEMRQAYMDFLAKTV